MWSGLKGLMIDIKSLKKTKSFLGLLFVSPLVLGILIFIAGPVIFSFVLSFFYWDVLSPMKYAGLDNYQWFLEDEVAHTVIYNSIFFSIISVIILNILGFTLALGLTKIVSHKIRIFYRSIYFFPLLMSGATVSIVMAFMFNTDLGIINYYLSFIFKKNIGWVSSSDVVMYTIIIVYVWKHFGFTFILYVGAFATMSKDVLDSSDVDGATGLKKVMYIYIPLASPTIFFSTIVGIISAIQVFDEPFVLTKGGPGDSSRTAVIYIYDVAFRDLEFGYGSVIAVAIFMIIMLMTVIQFMVQKKWVHYE